MKQLARSFWVRVTVGVSVLCIVCGTAIQKILYYSADPTGEKDCPPLSPGSDVPQATNVSDPYGTLPWEQKGGTINDASCLDSTAVYGIVEVRSEKDIKDALQFAKDKGLTVSIAGVKHSMGGQAFARNAVVLDIRNFNTVTLNEERQSITVQSGATWHQIQEMLHPKFAVKAMQSTDIFTVGGSISVNAHGMDHRSGSVGQSIRSMRVMLPDGSIRTVSRAKDAELFRHVVGGYGLFGIILDAELDIVPNDLYESERQVIGYKEFPEVFQKDILPNENLGLFYGHLSTSPGSFLKEMILYTYTKSDDQTGEIPPLTEVSSVKLRRFFINFSKKGSIAMRLKWFTEKYVEPRVESCSINRNQAQGSGEACLVSRNEPMHDSVPYLKNALKNDTDILHEYFIPRDQFIPFVNGMRDILENNNTTLLNASVRVVHKEDTALNYAPKDAFAIVLYINQTTDAEGNTRMKKVTSELIDLTAKVGGRFFLPYQLHYTPEQLLTSYPELPAFAAMKKKYDPELRLTNTWYNTYVKGI
jgi:FAD/FMN-containing dehydrogenase